MVKRIQDWLSGLSDRQYIAIGVGLMLLMAAASTKLANIAVLNRNIYYCDQFADLGTCMTAANKTGGTAKLFKPGTYNITPPMQIGSPSTRVYFEFGGDVIINVSAGGVHGPAICTFDQSSIWGHPGYAFSNAGRPPTITLSSSASITDVVAPCIRDSSIQSYDWGGFYVLSNTTTTVIDQALIHINGFSSTYVHNLSLSTFANTIGLFVDNPDNRAITASAVSGSGNVISITYSATSTATPHEHRTWVGPGGGSGYSASPVLTFTNCTVQPGVTPVVVGGVIRSVTVNTGGSGCTRPVGVITTDSTGSGAQFRTLIGGGAVTSVLPVTGLVTLASCSGGTGTYNGASQPVLSIVDNTHITVLATGTVSGSPTSCTATPVLTPSGSALTTIINIDDINSNASGGANGRPIVFSANCGAGSSCTGELSTRHLSAEGGDGIAWEINGNGGQAFSIRNDGVFHCEPKTAFAGAAVCVSVKDAHNLDLGMITASACSSCVNPVVLNIDQSGAGRTTNIHAQGFETANWVPGSSGGVLINNAIRGDVVSQTNFGEYYFAGSSTFAGGGLGVNLLGLALPTTPNAGDIWSDSGDGDHLKLYTGSIWVGQFATTATIDFASVATGACSADSTITFTGAIANEQILVDPPINPVAGIMFYAFGIGTNQAKVRMCNFSGGAVDLASGVYSFREMR